MKIETILDHQTILENRRPQAFFAVRFEAPATQETTADPGAYCLVIDQSYSIDDHESELVRRFSSQFIRHVPANSVLSIVTFHGGPEAIFELAPPTDNSALEAIVNEVQSIDYGTNLSAALLLAREQLLH